MTKTETVEIVIEGDTRRPNGQIAPNVFNALKTVYGFVPQANCKGLCHHSCVHIVMLPVEVAYFRHRGLALPMAGDHNGRCSHLTPDNKCAVYDARPLVCRMYGASETLLCPHGCKPSPGALDVDGTMSLVDAVHHIGNAAGLVRHQYFTGGDDDYADLEAWGREIAESDEHWRRAKSRRIKDFDAIEAAEGLGVRP